MAVSPGGAWFPERVLCEEIQMKKFVVLFLAMLMVAGVQAKDKGAPKGPVTKEAFLAQQQKKAEKGGGEFDQAVAEALFAKLDKNSDGVLSADEVAAGKKAEKAAAEEAPSEE